ncbi:MAG TPA: hypothetical protein VM686_02010 [Polyangiaceae bacterium]|nr:hypothetical protein [Polyangiaceae bacterium]
MSVSRTLLLGLLLGAALPAPCFAQSSAETPEVARARESFEHGLKLFESGQHRQALAEFQRAYSLAPSFRIFYNIGLVNVALGDAAAAIQAFQRYLREGADKVPAARREQVEHEIARLSQRAAALIVDVDTAEAAVMIDGKPAGKSPLEGRVWLNPGRYRVSVSSGSARREQDVELTAGAERVLRFELAKSEAPAPAVQPSEEPVAEQSESGSSVPWVAWGVTAALGVGAGVTGGLALSAKSDEDELKKTEDVSKGELEDARDDVARWALVSDVFLAATVVSAGVSLYLTLSPGGDEKPAAALIVAPRGVAARFQF